ncbi:hypothetical protein SDRG_17055 [Saprolegnia diclina VS20]|uniref:Peptidase C1A papain C-terminal domain-containing protein n=1 Tax=Saprolegnia diclina (strain VS20) TaxID=1156394 RepID=T0QZ84_SAPDV|nr:hypothetical protein SDRG_17055 [Saprolegnia diclina VS20]EQC25063.1 hypothetical protein SDRG_17055 [Saprolegnia diclina VS20]|eukprot:XP_008621512.1 hypothetical protein SDRG_17055 [Saprolegnia diclina VS20]
MRRAHYLEAIMALLIVAHEAGAASSLGTLLGCTSRHVDCCLWTGPDGSAVSSRRLLQDLEAAHPQLFQQDRALDHMQSVASNYQASGRVPYRTGLSVRHLSVGRRLDAAPWTPDSIQRIPRRLEHLAPLHWCKPNMNPLQKNVCSTIKSQHACGSCWAFASATAIETSAAMRAHSVPKLSVQELLDSSRGNISATMNYCWLTPERSAAAPWLVPRLVWRARNDGCAGGMPFGAFDYATTHGISTEFHWPYTSAATPSVGGSSAPVVKVQSWTQAMGRDCNSSADPIVMLQRALRTQPLAVIIVSSGGFEAYKGGIYVCPNNGTIASSKTVDHALLLVGYDYDPNLGLYWILQNSYGVDWGEAGYMRLLADDKLNCGLNLMPLAVTADVLQVPDEHVDSNGVVWSFLSLDAAAWVASLVAVAVLTLLATIAGVLRSRRPAKAHKSLGEHLVL